jgi:hypothetical protein
MKRDRLKYEQSVGGLSIRMDAGNKCGVHGRYRDIEM